MNRKTLFTIFNILIIAAFLLSACAQQPRRRASSGTTDCGRDASPHRNGHPPLAHPPG